MLKRIASIAMGIAMLFTGSVFASEINFTAVADNEQGVINISGTAPAAWGNRTVAIMVGRPVIGETALDYDTLEETAFVTNIYTLTEALCNGSGAFSAQIKFSDDATLGYYLIRVGATGLANDSQNDKRVLFATKEDAEAVLALVNAAANGSGIKAVIDGFTSPGNLPHDEILSLDTSDAMYAANSDTVCDYIYALKSTKYKTVSDLQTAFVKSCALAEITHCESSQTQSKIEQHAALLNIDITCNEYTKNKAAVATLVKSNIAKLPEYTTKPEKFFSAMSAVAAINAANRNTVMGIVEDYAESLDITLGVEYNSLSSYEVGKALVEKNFTDVKGVQDALSSRIAALIAEKDDDGGGSGGGGGGGGGPSGIGITTPKPIEPIVEETAPSKKEAFSDVSTSHWAYEAINELSDKEIINGMGDGTFDPNGSVKREQIAKMVVLAFGGSESVGESFSDVDADAWYAPFVAAALESGIVNGMGNGVFGVGKEVSRQDLMVMLYRALINENCKFTPADIEAFSDSASISDYAAEAVAALAGSGIVSGTNGAIEPKRICTRAEAAKLIFEAMKKLEERTEAGIYEN